MSLDVAGSEVTVPFLPTALKAIDVSADGSRVVGVGESLLPPTMPPTAPPDGNDDSGKIVPPDLIPPEPGFEFSFIWDEGVGMRLLEDVLLHEYGFAASGQLDGWDLGRVAAISDDGTTIVGTGINPQGQQEAWRVVLGRMTMPGDANFDGDVDRDDLAIWRAGAGMTEGADFVDGDFDFNGQIDGDDLMTLLLQYGRTSATFHPAGAGAGGVPEPASTLLVLVVVVPVACFYGLGRRYGSARSELRY